MDFFFWGVNMANTVKQTTKERNLTDILLGNINPEDQDIVFPKSGEYDEIEKEFNEIYSNINLNVTSVADEFLVHPNYLSKLFKKQMQMNMLSYVNNVRINEAKRLLSNTNYSLEEICDKTGFGSYRTFIRVFHQIVSISPSRYRNLTSNKN